MKQNVTFSALILAFLVLMVVYSLKYQFQARLFPLVVGIPAIGLIAIVLVRSIVAARSKKEKDAAAALMEESTGFPAGWKVTTGVIAWIAGFVALIFVAGFNIAVLLFVFCYLKYHKASWLRSAIVAASIEAGMYGIFTIGMKMPFYPGLLFS